MASAVLPECSLYPRLQAKKRDASKEGGMAKVVACNDSRPDVMSAVHPPPGRRHTCRAISSQVDLGGGAVPKAIAIDRIGITLP